MGHFKPDLMNRITAYRPLLHRLYFSFAHCLFLIARKVIENCGGNPAERLLLQDPPAHQVEELFLDG